MTKPICYVMVGLPAIGKSTFVEEIIRDNPTAFLYSTDTALEKIASQLNMTYDEVFGVHFKNAQKEIDAGLVEAIKSKLDIVWDQTNLGLKKRKTIINRMRQSGYDIWGIVFMPPNTQEDKDAWNTRLNNRPGKNIPGYVLANMQKSYVLPEASEGFDKIFYADMYGKIIEN